LQEVDRNKKRSGKTNTAKLLADELGLYYAWAAPPTVKPNEEEETGVALLSVHPLTKITVSCCQMKVRITGGELRLGHRSKWATWKCEFILLMRKLAYR